MIINDEQARMLVEAGFRPGWMCDVRDGDVIMFHEYGSSQDLTELTVSGVWASSDGHLINFIGIKPDGTAKPYCYGPMFPLYLRSPA